MYVTLSATAAKLNLAYIDKDGSNLVGGIHTIKNLEQTGAD